jgi:hypothetical protein
MALGVVALAVSVIMFAAESTKLSSEVWMSCVAVLGGVIALSLLPITFVAFLIDILSFNILPATKQPRLFGPSLRQARKLFPHDIEYYSNRRQIFFITRISLILS